MAYLGESDVLAMLADLSAAGGGVAVTFGSTTVTGLLDREALEVFGADMPATIAGEESIHIATGSLPDLVSGSAVTVGGIAYVVQKVLPYGDGAMTRIALRKP